MDEAYAKTLTKHENYSKLPDPTPTRVFLKNSHVQLATLLSLQLNCGGKTIYLHYRY